MVVSYSENGRMRVREEGKHSFKSPHYIQKKRGLISDNFVGILYKYQSAGTHLKIFVSNNMCKYGRLFSTLKRSKDI